jgi:hypothetical protein
VVKIFVNLDASASLIKKLPWRRIHSWEEDSRRDTGKEWATEMNRKGSNA